MTEPLIHQSAIERAAIALQQMWENEGIEDVGDSPTPWGDLSDIDRESWRTWARIALEGAASDEPQPLGGDSPCPFCGEDCFGNRCLDEPDASRDSQQGENA